MKPANIMIEPSGQVKVMDFGIAKLETAANLTSTGLIMGTPNYMSPEQARGLKVDGRSDLFSLGCVLYECLTGTRPFQAESVSGILVKILTEEPPPVDFRATGLPAEVGAVLSRAMAKEPSARYASGAEMIEALRADAPEPWAPPPSTVQAVLPASASPAPRVRKRPRLLRPRRGAPGDGWPASRSRSPCSPPSPGSGGAADRRCQRAVPAPWSSRRTSASWGVCWGARPACSSPSRRGPPSGSRSTRR